MEKKYNLRIINELKFDEKGLIPAIIQDIRDNQVLNHYGLYHPQRQPHPPVLHSPGADLLGGHDRLLSDEPGQDQ